MLPQFSKVLEELFCNRLNKFIERHKILSNNQYGFRNNHSTPLAPIDLIEKLTNYLDNKRITVGIFIDLKKAFDTIDHELLLRKLERYGVRGIEHNWLKSYMNNRKQYVSFDNVNSSLLDITCGVPQGSILGPILFILYINDLCNVSEFLKFVLFAEDTNLFASGDNIVSLCNEINKELYKINVWFRINKLSLNLNKTSMSVRLTKSPAGVQFQDLKKIVIFDQVLQAHFSLLDKTYTQVQNYNIYSFTVPRFI